MIKRTSIYLFLIVLMNPIFAQYWFGPKIGFTRAEHVYQRAQDVKDSFNVKANYNFQFGAVFNYTASQLFSVYGELTYDRIGRSLVDKETEGQFVRSSITNHFISAPLMLRISLGNGPIKFYVNGGPRLSYWLGGSGELYHEVYEEAQPFGVDENNNALSNKYSISFNSSDRQSDGNEFINRPQRMQYGLTVGFGSLLDMYNGSRIMVDFRYTWVHSNMANNSGEDTLQIGIPTDSDYYRENYEFSHNLINVSVGYLLNYNSSLKRKGKSTNKRSNK